MRPSEDTPIPSSNSRPLRDEEGGASVLLFAVVLFLAAGAIGAMAILSTTARAVRQGSALAANRRMLERAARSVLARLAQDPTPGADSAFDPIWSYVSAGGASGVRFSLSDLSSRVDLNLVRVALFEETKLGDLMLPGRTAAGLRQYRADKGPFKNLEAYAKWFPPAVLHNDFTVYGNINVNTTFEGVLSTVFAARTGDAPASEVFRTQIRRYLRQKQLIGSSDLRGLFGLYYPQLYPLMNVRPQINVNFVPEADLRAILSYPYGGHPLAKGRAIADAILARRRTGEVSEQYLTGLIHATGEQRLVLQYLGVRTWFWRIGASNHTGSVGLVVVRIPGQKSDSFAILEDQFSADRRGKKG